MDLTILEFIPGVPRSDKLRILKVLKVGIMHFVIYTQVEK